MVEAAVEAPEDLVKKLGGSPVFVEQVEKMNDHYQWQKRFIVITRSRFYNMKPPNFFHGWSIQREFEIDHIQGIVLRTSTSSSEEFLLKISSSASGDYRYRANCGENLANTLQSLRPHLRVWEVTVDLDVYHRMKKRSARADVFVIECKNSSRSSTSRTNSKA